MKKSEKIEIPTREKLSGKENQQDNSVPNSVEDDEKDFNPTEKYPYPFKILPNHKRLTPENSPTLSRRSGSPGQRRKMIFPKEGLFPSKEGLTFDIGHLLPDLSEDSDYLSSSEDLFNSPKINAPKVPENLVKKVTNILPILNEDPEDRENFSLKNEEIKFEQKRKEELDQLQRREDGLLSPKKTDIPNHVIKNENANENSEKLSNNNDLSSSQPIPSNMGYQFNSYPKSSFQIFQNQEQKWNLPPLENLPNGSSNGLPFESKYFKQDQNNFLTVNPNNPQGPSLHNPPPSPTRFQTFNPQDFHYPNLLVNNNMMNNPHINNGSFPISPFPNQNNNPSNNAILSGYYPIKQNITNPVPPIGMNVNKRASICRYFLLGQCMRGNNCNFLHSNQPMKPTETIIPKNVPPPVSLKKPANITTMEESIGHIYYLCKDQQGCRFLQKKIEEETETTVPIIFNEIHQHFAELMVDPFGNYLCQKLLDHCNDLQRLQIIESVGTELVYVAQNMHGTRAVQKLIECLTLPQQITKIIEAFSYNVVQLIQDLNGNHVIQRCLNKLSSQDNQFIYDAVTKSCVEVATHRHGCCVLQRCIDFASESQKKQLIDEIISNALALVQDPYGNYVTQYVLELNLESCKNNLISKFQNNIVRLSTQKFSSNVVEKCLQLADKKHRKVFLTELINTKNLGNLLQDPYANYVIQTALTVSDPQQYRLLVEKIKPFLPSLRHTPHGRRILKNCNKKI
eukprot:TRINITY_DN3814_c0_g1_i1.p1 TRINITY_DN3814_c0_g1~~TRINITY_DN3814_c0_g1_i1.p1  ORF type:complete len:738 (-),score=215.68 TRINITY_DN3814_c0_g1_i1:164-2377(-)